MKILLLSNPVSSHTIKWVNALTEKGVEICLVSLNPAGEKAFNNPALLQTVNIGFTSKSVSRKPGSLSKVRYLTLLSAIKKAIKNFHPDVIHSHYASSYGLLGALTGFHPFVLSVWGSDIYRIPEKSFLHKWLIKYSLKKADWVLSTSKAMVKNIHQYSDKDVLVTPFGVDTDFFKPGETDTGHKVRIGTVKLLKKIYGVNILIRAFNIVLKRNEGMDLHLLIVGDGPERRNLERLAEKLGLSDHVEFAGYQEPGNIPYYLNKMDIFSALSVMDESFGVSVLEAGACGLPSVVSDVPGFKEIVRDGETGFVVPRKDARAAADALEKLMINKTFRESMGRNARKQVEDFYSLEESVNKMLGIYKKATKEAYSKKI
ncbi:MAG: glycosyltransferase [Bacteroidales bacterium]